MGVVIVWVCVGARVCWLAVEEAVPSVCVCVCACITLLVLPNSCLF